MNCNMLRPISSSGIVVSNGGGDVEKSVRWENVDLRTAGLSKGELLEIRDHLIERLAHESALSAPRLKKAIKAANSLLNAPKPKKQKNDDAGGHYFGEPPVGRYNGGFGQVAFVRGGAPGSKR
jgi:hypothetical protein